MIGGFSWSGREGERNDKTCDTTMHLFLCLLFYLFLPIYPSCWIHHQLATGWHDPTFFLAVIWTITRHRTLEKRKVFGPELPDHPKGEAFLRRYTTAASSSWASCCIV